jgi:hypothetical protein
MGVSNELISQLAKAVTEDVSTNRETTVYGTIAERDGSKYVQLDGSDQLTPVSLTTDVKVGERVLVQIKNHTAIVIGNVSSPSAASSDVKGLGAQIVQLGEVVADKVSTDQLNAEKAKIDALEADNVVIKESLAASEADIGDIKAENIEIAKKLEAAEGNISKLSTDKLDADAADIKYATVDKLNAAEADIRDLEATYGEFEKLATDKLSAVEADISDIEADNVHITEKLDAAEAEIDKLRTDKLDAAKAEITYATIEYLDAINANINELTADHGEFKTLTTGQLSANSADISDLKTDKLSTKDAAITYANIDFSNIGKAAIEYFYATSGLIKDVVVGDGTITGELVGVTIKGDLIEGNTIKAEKLVVKGEDGLYYKLNVEAGATTSEEVTEEQLQNGLSGSVIIANTITAEKINVDDLVAFDATIGGFHITDDAIYSGVKGSIDNTTDGVYMDSTGQFSVGDSNNYFKYYRDDEGNYRLDISASTIHFGSSGKSVEEAIEEANDVRIGARNLIRNSKNLIFENYKFANLGTSAVLGASILGAMILGEE